MPLRFPDVFVALGPIKGGSTASARPCSCYSSRCRIGVSLGQACANTDGHGKRTLRAFQLPAARSVDVPSSPMKYTRIAYVISILAASEETSTCYATTEKSIGKGARDDYDCPSACGESCGSAFSATDVSARSSGAIIALAATSAFPCTKSFVAFTQSSAITRLFRR